MKSDVKSRSSAQPQPESTARHVPSVAAHGPRLRPADARAVDLLLETAMHGAMDGGTNGGSISRMSKDSSGSAAGSMTMSGFSGFNSFSSPSDDGMAERVDAADQLLRLLDHLPAGDPPDSLVTSTLRRVEEARGGSPRGATSRTAASPTATTPGAAPAPHSPEAPEGA